MKVKTILLSTILLGGLPVGQTTAQSHPVCASSTSDPDGDGYGWENNKTCLVETDQSGPDQPSVGQGQCEDRGGYPWGWNPVTLTSCRLDEQPGECVDEDGDGLGWDGVNSCRVTPSTGSETIEDILVGTWLCQSQYAASAGDAQPATGEFPNNLNGQLEWRYYELPVQGAPFPGYTVDKQRITFRANSTVAISGAFEFENSFVFGGDNPGSYFPATQGTWKLENFRLVFSDDFRNLSAISKYSLFAFTDDDKPKLRDEGVPALYFYRVGNPLERRTKCVME